MTQFIVFLPSILIGLFFFLFTVLLPLRYKKLNANLVDYYKGTENYLLGEISLVYSTIKFRISRISRGGRGYYLGLWTYVTSVERIIIGHAQSAKYTRGKFLFLPTTETVDLGSMQVVIGADDPGTIEKIKAHLADKKFINACSVLFNEKFNYLTVASEIHFSKFIPKKKYVLRYSPLSDRIYVNPEDLKYYLESITDICSVLNIETLID